MDGRRPSRPKSNMYAAVAGSASDTVIEEVERQRNAGNVGKILVSVSEERKYVPPMMPFVYPRSDQTQNVAASVDHPNAMDTVKSCAR